MGAKRGLCSSVLGHFAQSEEVVGGGGGKGCRNCTSVRPGSSLQV